MEFGIQLVDRLPLLSGPPGRVGVVFSFSAAFDNTPPPPSTWVVKTQMNVRLLAIFSHHH